MKQNSRVQTADEELWTVKEAAKFLRINPVTMWRYAKIPEKKGGPTVYRIGTNKTMIRLPKQKFLAWLAAPKGL